MATSLILLWIVQLLMHDMAFVTSDPPVQNYNASVQSTTESISVTVGDEIVLPCSVVSAMSHEKVFWYKQSLGMAPLSFVSFKKNNNKGTFLEQFENTKRFELNIIHENSELHIGQVELSDSGVYNCVRVSYGEFYFLTSITVTVKDSIPGQSINNAVFETTQKGSSETLKCVVDTWLCGETPRVLWLGESEESASETDAHNCTVNVCGQVLTGNGTKPSAKESADGVAVHVLGGALVLSSAAIVGLVVFVCVLKKKINSLRAAMDRAGASMSTRPNGGAQGGESLHYAAVRLNAPSKQRRTVSTDCVYATVKPR